MRIWLCLHRRDRRNVIWLGIVEVAIRVVSTTADSTRLSDTVDPRVGAFFLFNVLSFLLQFKDSRFESSFLFLMTLIRQLKVGVFLLELVHLTRKLLDQRA